jgi:hypothetical protein
MAGGLRFVRASDSLDRSRRRFHATPFRSAESAAAIAQSVPLDSGGNYGLDCMSLVKFGLLQRGNFVKRFPYSRLYFNGHKTEAELLRFQDSRTRRRTGSGGRVLEPTARPEMRTRNDYSVAVVWATVIGLVIGALWLKVPLG